MRARAGAAASLGPTLIELATHAPSLPVFRMAVLQAVKSAIEFDVGLIHALSPRVPLATGAFLGIEASEIAATLPEWDRNAVELGRVRDHALAHGGVATDREALPLEGASRRRFERVLGAQRRIRSAIFVHAIVRENIVSAMVLARLRLPAFDAKDAESMRLIAPAFSLADALQQQLDGSERAALPTKWTCLDQRLTARERELVEHVVMGQTNAQIACALDLSSNTIRNQLANIMKKLAVANRAEIVRSAVLRPL